MYEGKFPSTFCHQVSADARKILRTCLNKSPSVRLSLKALHLVLIVQELKETFPPLTPSPSDPYEYIMYRAGQVECHRIYS